MSSFRPDVGRVASEFVPGLFPVAGAGFEPAGPIGSRREGSSETPAVGAPVSAAEPADEVWPPARLAALEQAAFDRGVASAREESVRVEALCQALEEALRPIRQTGTTWLGVHREALIDLALQIAEAWVGRALPDEEGLLGDAIDLALSGLAEEEALRLLLCERDLRTLEEREPARVARWREELGVRLECAPDLAPGEHRIEGLHRVFDARFDAIREGLRDALVDALEAPAPAPAAAADALAAPESAAFVGSAPGTDAPSEDEA
ncbi:MAG: hypothetical protein H6748_21195 [Spirochaetaceae bacterium]|nr:hypothetical protein [Myxococcales bacterium]MCB9726576.1 hypothetical protein [Spirochaetaceae bacterium]HPG25789.1 hypothetical protein [Myxococcota bacterium]